MRAMGWRALENCLAVLRGEPPLDPVAPAIVVPAPDAPRRARAGRRRPAGPPLMAARIFSFYGVTTGGSLIMRIFPRWAEHLGLEDVRIEGTDLPIHADPAVYRARVERLKADDAEVGALVTTHKIDLFAACRRPVRRDRRARGAVR